MTSHATLNGTITVTGGENADSRGFEWGTDLGGPYPNSWTEAGGYGTGSFSHQVTGLTEDTTWYYRSKAHNSGGWGYGAESSFISAKSITVSDGGTSSEVAETAPVVFVAESCVGQDAQSLAISISPTDQGQDADTPSVSAQVNIAETSAGIESSLNVQNVLAPAEAGVGIESLAVAVGIPVAESGAVVDAPNIVASIPINDSAVDSETVTPSSALTVSDAGFLSNENVTTPGTLTVTEEGKGAEFAWRVKPSSPMIDALVLPHVLSIKISDPATMSDKKVQGGSLPRRKMVGKPGRIVDIGGWSDSQTEIDALDALRDGVRRTFYHPSGDSFGVFVTGFEPSRTVDEYNRRTYRLSLAEAN